MTNFVVCLLFLSLCVLSENSSRQHYQIDVKQSKLGKACPSNSPAAEINLNLLCEPNNGAQWFWSSTPIVDQGDALKIYESIDSKPAATTPPTHHATTCDLVWVDASKANVSQIPHKIKGGYEENGEDQFICRTRDPVDPNSFTGKLTTRQGLCLISWVPDRAYNAHYQVLTNPKNVPIHWVPASAGHVPRNAWKAGEVKIQSTPSDYYVGRAKVGKSLQLGKIKVKGVQKLWYVNNRHYRDYGQVRSKVASSLWYYKNLDNNAQEGSVSYEALVVC